MGPSRTCTIPPYGHSIPYGHLPLPLYDASSPRVHTIPDHLSSTAIPYRIWNALAWQAIIAPPPPLILIPPTSKEEKKKKKGPILCSLTTPVRLSIDSGNHQTVKKKKKRERRQKVASARSSQTTRDLNPPSNSHPPSSSLRPSLHSARAKPRPDHHDVSYKATPISTHLVPSRSGPCKYTITSPAAGPELPVVNISHHSACVSHHLPFARSLSLSPSQSPSIVVHIEPSVARDHLVEIPHLAASVTRSFAFPLPKWTCPILSACPTLTILSTLIHSITAGDDRL